MKFSIVRLTKINGKIEVKRYNYVLGDKVIEKNLNKGLHRQ